MASSINALTSSGGGVVTTADASGVLNLQSNGTTVAAVSSTGVAVTGDVSATGAITATGQIAALKSGTALAYNWNGLTTNASLDFTGIPSWAKKIEVIFSGLSNTGQNITFLVGTGSTTWINTGYLTTSGQFQNGNTTSVGAVTSSFKAQSGGGTRSDSGVLTLYHMGSNLWVGNLNMQGGNSIIQITTGSIQLGAALTGVRVTTDVADTFDAGIVNIFYT